MIDRHEYTRSRLNRRKILMWNRRTLTLAAIALISAVPAQAQTGNTADVAQPTYADLAGLSDRAEAVIHAQIRKQIVLEPERAPGLSPGFARLYIEAQTLSLIAGRVPLGESLKYLVDVPLDSTGKTPKLKKQEAVLFARLVPGRPGEIQLVAPTAQLIYSADLVARLRPILTELSQPDSPPVISGVADALSVAGNLSGESETQIFLDTQEGGHVSLSILRRPGRDPVWGVSWGEIIDQAARPPRPESIEWFRLACTLPSNLPPSTNLSRDQAERAQAVRDYSFVIGSLGPCVRTIALD